MGYAVLSVVGVFIFVLVFEPYPLIFVVAYALAIFLSAYFLHQGAPFVLILFTILALLIFPIVGNVDEGVTLVIAGAILISETVAVVVVQLAHGVLPDPPETESAETPSMQTAYSPH